MSEIKPKKEKRFLKTLGRVGEILVEQVLLKIGSSLIKKIGGKKPLPSILFLFLSLSLFAQFPNTGNKQRLGFQTTADGLTWRGSISDTASIQPINNTSAWVILDTINLKFYTFDFTSNTWNALPQGTNIDTTSLSNRIDLKLNISDTAAMLLPYATKIYVDTAGRFYARQDFENVQTSTLTWTQSDTLVPLGVNKIMVYRNGQILLPSQYTIPNKTTIIIAATSFKVGENYTVIFPKGGGGSGGSGGGGGGGGSVTSISQGTGIIATPNPIVSTGSIAADTSFLITRFDTLAMLAPYFRDADTSLLNLTSRFAAKQNNITLTTSGASGAATFLNDTLNIPQYSSGGGSGTVTSVATGYGLSGGTITTTGTLLLDSAVVFSQIRDSIVDVAIGNDTIKILKQEYAPATTSVLTWTITPKFPIQLKAYILVFRNGQLLINDQYNLTDTNKITIVSNSFKVGANYTVVTVSGIGSVGTGTFPNPVYPEAGIAVSTGSAWASSIPNNSSNWNIAFNDKINNAAFTGTTTKTLTLTQYDGGTFTPTFTDLQGVTGVTAGTGLTGGTITSTGTVAVNFGVVAPLANPTFTGTVSGITKSMVGLGNVDNTSDANKPISTATQTALNLKVNISDTASMLTNYLRSGVAASTYLTQSNAASTYLPLSGGTLTGSLAVNSSSVFNGTGGNNDTRIESDNNPNMFFVDASENNVGIGTNTPSSTLSVNGSIGVNGGAVFNGTGGNNDTRIESDNNPNMFFVDASENNVGIGTNTPSSTLSVNGTLGVTGNITEGGNNVLTNLDTASLSSRVDTKLNKTDTTAMLNPYWRADKYSGTLPIANGGTGAESASVARTTLGVGYVFVEVTAGSSVTITSNRVSIVNTGGFSTTQLDLTPATNGRMYMIKNLALGTVTSLNSNVIPLAGGSPTTAILSAGNVTPQWVTLVADGTNWHVMQSN